MRNSFSLRSLFQSNNWMKNNYHHLQQQHSITDCCMPQDMTIVIAFRRSDTEFGVSVTRSNNFNIRNSCDIDISIYLFITRVVAVLSSYCRRSCTFGNSFHFELIQLSQ